MDAGKYLYCGKKFKETMKSNAMVNYFVSFMYKGKKLKIPL